jgi:methionine sulfoxide reductase catalytic subunit
MAQERLTPTPEGQYARRREFLQNLGIFSAASAALGGGLWALSGGLKPRRRGQADGGDGSSVLEVAAKGQFVVPDPATPEADITSYNNFYELGLGKGDPAESAHTLRLRPWTISVDGLVEKPQTIDLDTLLKWFPLEERVYRMRCVEAWSMVIPWVGFSLGALIDKLAPLGSAKYVEFETLNDPEQLPGLKASVLDWPYREGLRLDEARHPLAFLAVGLYGKTLLGQNGAPLRLVVPWKYGFKGIKSIVRLRFTETVPQSTWWQAAPKEYGFWANVNPQVDHPRWSQATERRIGELERRPTLPFNGYADQVAHLYAGMDPSQLY